MKREGNKGSQDYEEYLDYDTSNLKTEWNERMNTEIREENLEDEFDHRSADQDTGYDYGTHLEEDNTQGNLDSSVTYYDETGQYRSRHDYHGQMSETMSRPFEFHPTDEHLLPPQLADQSESFEEAETETESEPLPNKRTKYSPKVDRFLTNGIIVVTVLLVAVLLIAFLV